MKHLFYILTSLFLLTACNQNDPTTHHTKSDSVTTQIATNIWRAERYNGNTASDSLIVPYDSLFTELNLNLVEISKKQFQSYLSSYKTGCALDSGQFIQGSGIYVRHDCDEICQTYLCENGTNIKMLMPSDYDAGILNMLLSPSCHQLMVCSSYDGPDYGEYYDHRAEIFIFNVSTGNGLLGIKPAFKYYTKEWSIDDMTWANDNTLALKLYREGKGGNDENLKYRYFKTTLR